MNIKKGDNVKVLAGKDHGKTGKVIQVLRDDSRVMVVVEGVNKLKKHLRAGRGRGKEKGQVIELPAPLPMSRVMIIDAKTGKPSRKPSN